ncbi:MAG: glycosyltransferase family 39 protein [Caldilineaceae bacterium]
MSIHALETSRTAAALTTPRSPRRFAASGIWLPLAVYLIIATAYLLAVPPLEGFDAVAHMNAINFYRTERHFPLFDRATGDFSYELIAQPPLYHVLGALATAWLPYDNAAQYVQESANRYFPERSQHQSVILPQLPTAVSRALLVARLVSLLGGVLTVTATWLWVRTVLPDQAWLPTAVTAVVALNPLFLFISTSITNDAWAAAGTVVVIWLVTAAAAREKTPWYHWLLVGVVTGLAVLIKYSVPIVAAPALLILLQYGRQRPIGRFMQIAAMLFAGAVLTAGFWYGRSMLLYGSPIPLAAMSEALIALQRPVLMPLAQVWAILPFLFYSYWGLFVAIFAPEPFLRTVQWMVLLAVVGLPIGLYRAWGTAVGKLIWLALLWFGLNLLSMINYMRLISYGEQARFLLPGAPALGLLMVLGWQAWLPSRYASGLRVLVLPFFVLLALWPWPTLRAAHALPNAVPAEAAARPIHATFEGGETVIGYTLPAGAALAPGAPLPLTLYLTTAQPIAQDQTLFLHLVDDQDRLLFQFDGVTYAGRHPTRQWRPGEVFRDDYALQLAAPVTADTLATLTVGFYEIGEPNQRLPVFDHTGAEFGDRLVLSKIRVLAAPPRLITTPVQPLAQWAGGIDLLNAAIEPGDSDQIKIALSWRTTALLATDYTVFVQFLNAAGDVVAQRDAPPQAGQAPTSTWLVNEEIVDNYQLAAPASWARLIVGFYNAQNGERLPLATLPAQDYFELQAVR